jgi:hypothetical protein
MRNPIFLICFVANFVDADNFWTGKICHPGSNSSNYEASLKKCGNESVPFLESLGKCFYWVSGMFIENWTGSETQRNVRHVCSNNVFNLSKIDVYRVSVKTMFTLNNESILHRNQHDCKEELPFGYFPLRSIGHIHDVVLTLSFQYTRHRIF